MAKIEMLHYNPNIYMYVNDKLHAYGIFIEPEWFDGVAIPHSLTHYNLTDKGFAFMVENNTPNSKGDIPVEFYHRND